MIELAENQIAEDVAEARRRLKKDAAVDLRNLLGTIKAIESVCMATPRFEDFYNAARRVRMQ